MSEDNNVMEFIDAEQTVSVDTDLTILTSGDHSIGMNFGEGSVKVPVKVDRDLSKMQVTYEHNNHVYTHMITPEGLVYSSVKFLGNDESPSREWQQKGMWRYF